MANYDIRTLQLHILKILSAVDKVCQEHNLRYYIVDGTMLGAIRHGGFIPWDDDIDIGMPRKDYDLFIKHSEQWLPKPYELICGENSEEYPLPFAKVQDSSTTLAERISFQHIGGVYMDVFPLDGIPQNKWKQKKFLRKYKFFKHILYFMARDPYKHGKGVSSWLPLLLQKVYSRAQIQRKIRKIQMQYDYDSCEYCINHDDGPKSIMPKKILGKPTPVLFENQTFMGVEDYDTYLTYIYGDYMKIPDVDKQIQHNFHYIDFNTPYRSYQKQDNNYCLPKSILNT